MQSKERAHSDECKRSNSRAQLEREEVLDIVEDRFAFFDCGKDSAEVVVNKDHVGGFFCYVCARLAHGDADVGHFESRCVIDC